MVRLLTVLDLARLLHDRLFSAVQPGLAALSTSAGSLEVGELDRILGPLAGVRFEPQGPSRRRGERFVSSSSYDGSITLRGAVPTRPHSTHDLMNALVWASFPRSKRAIHARQFAALSAEVEEGAAALPGRRSRLRDRLSMLDEGGLLIVARPPLAPLEELLACADAAALAALGAAGRHAVWVFGHAILEHAACASGSGVRASVVVLEAGPSLAEADEALAAALTRPDDALERWLARWPSLDAAALAVPALSAG